MTRAPAHKFHVTPKDIILLNIVLLEYELVICTDYLISMCTLITLIYDLLNSNNNYNNFKGHKLPVTSPYTSSHTYLYLNTLIYCGVLYYVTLYNDSKIFAIIVILTSPIIPWIHCQAH